MVTNKWQIGLFCVALSITILAFASWSYIADASADSGVVWQAAIIKSFSREQIQAPTWKDKTQEVQDMLAAGAREREFDLKVESKSRADGGIDLLFTFSGHGLSKFREVMYDDANLLGGLLGGPILLELQGRVQSGEKIALAVDSNLSTGYAWSVAQAEASYLRVDDQIDLRPTANRPGAPSIRTIGVHALADGQTLLKLKYQRPWEPDRPATRHVTLQGDSLASLSNLTSPFPPAAEGPEDTGPLEWNSQPALQALASHFDWRDSYALTPVKDQDGCGSCWAFATVGVMESDMVIRDHLVADLSEQYLVSCNNDGWNCDGGWEAHKYHQWKFISPESTAGAVREYSYRYTASDSACSGGPHQHPYRINGWGYVGGTKGIPSVNAMKQAILNYGPIFTSFCAGSAFGNYASGIFTTDESNACGGSVNHAVVLTGWDDNQDPPYGIWYMRNSWGPGFGEQGYVRIRRGISLLGTRSSYAVYTWNPVGSTAFVEIDHGMLGAARVEVGVGNPSNPTCTVQVWNRQIAFQPNLYSDVGLSSCAAYLPPSSTNRWFLRVTDFGSGATGRINKFQIVSGGQTFTAVDTPLPIPSWGIATSHIPSTLNDDFGAASRISYTPYNVTQSTALATTAADDPTLSCGNQGRGLASVWYKFTPPSSGYLDIGTEGSNYDTVVGVWTGTRGNLRSVACNDDYMSPQSRTRLFVDKGVTYYIEVVQHGPTTGPTIQPDSPIGPEATRTLSLSVRFTILDNDEIFGARAINSTPYNYAQPTFGASTASDDPIIPCRGRTGTNSVWYRFRPTTYGLLKVNTQGSNYNTVVAVWRGSAGKLLHLGCNDDSVDTQTSYLEVPLSPLTWYYIEVADFNMPTAPTEPGSGGTPTNGGSLAISVNFLPMTNLLLNPSFETDANGDQHPDNWNWHAKFIRASGPIIDGKYSGEFLPMGATNTTIMQVINGVTAGQNMVLAGWFNSRNTTDTFIYEFQIIWYDAQNHVMGVDHIGTYNGKTGGWVHSYDTRMAPAGTVKARVDMTVSSLDGMPVFVDNLFFGHYP